ncbi:MAG TPA: bifunctional aspartate kinase/homoserine dehydrogenase I [Myxococcota bacterium]|nr:bifunctional aspartate kinase/homoserine dehydrogenase I [Myxococcota bacterium]
MAVEVHKFGGTSLGSAERMVQAAGLVRACDSSVVTVASAMGGVTDRLVHAATTAARGARGQALEAVEALLAVHLEALRELGDPPGVGEQIEDIGAELAELIGAVSRLAELTPRVRDRVLACGEKLSVRLLAAAMRSEGVDALAVDADTFLATDGRHGEASPLLVVYERTTRAALQPHLDAGRVPVVTGFCGQAPDGATTTLGRGGSDYTATLIAAALGADEVSIWTDVDGVYSADPRVVPRARIVPHLNYREAAELSYYGAKVLHQRTMIPVARAGIALRTRNSFRPEEPGTVVDSRFTPGSHPVKAISAIRDQQLLSVEGKGMAGVPGVAARAFGALAERNLSVTMISQSSSESSISMAVPAVHALAAESALKAAFRDELGRGDVEEVVVGDEVGLVAAVGLGMAHTPGVAARLFGALGDAKVNVLAIAQGSSELNVSIAVDHGDVDRAVRVLHDALGLHRIDTGAESADGLDLILLGPGAIGRAVVEQLQARREGIVARFGLSPRVVAVADTSGWVLEPAGLSDERLDSLLAAKTQGTPLARSGGTAGSADQLLDAALELRLTRPILVDCTDAASAPLWLRAMGAGCDVVTANKVPLAGSFELHTQLQETARTRGRLLRSEATVGAGLPVIETLEMLQHTGDALTLAEGCLSGTLGFLMARLQAGDRLSEAVKTAIELGYTEPDPVTDLSGVDVGRKALILGRLSGLLGADAVLEVEGLVETAWAGLPIPELMERLCTLDAGLAERCDSAAAAGKVLRYVARVTRGRAVVGPAEVDLDSPIGRLSGSDNLVLFRSERYAERPLVVIGPGAGVDVTAMGVLGDVLRVAAERS